LFKKTYKYTVDEKFEIVNCDLAIYVTEASSKKILTGIDIMAIPRKSDFLVNLNELVKTESNSTKSLSFYLENISDVNTDFVLNIENSESTPIDWSLNFPQGLEYSINANSKIEINAEIITGATKGFGEYTITISEKNNPVSNSSEASFAAVTQDIDYLEVNAGGSDLETIKSSRDDFISFDLETYKKVGEELNELDVVVWNCGPKGKISNDDALMINEMILKGVGVLFTGSGSIPNLALNDPDNSIFDLLGITWEFGNEIDIQTFTLEGISGDPITNGLSWSGLTVANNGYLMQKTSIANNAVAVPMLKMKENNATISARIENQYSRSVYLGFNLAILSEDDRNELVKRSIDWIEGVTSVEHRYENQEIEMSILPAQLGLQLIIVNRSKTIFDSNLEIYDLLGRHVYSEQIRDIQIGSNTQFINTDNLQSAFYFLKLNYGNKVIISKIIIN
jgi:hypothetical protein